MAPDATTFATNEFTCRVVIRTVNSESGCWYKHDTETSMEKVVTEIEKIWHEIARVDLDLRNCIKCHEYEKQIQSLQTLLHLQDQKICAIAKGTSTNAVSHKNKTIKKSYFGMYEVYQKPSKANISQCHNTPV